MTGKELALLLAPLLGMVARDRLRALTVGAVGDIAIAYDEVSLDDWAKLAIIITEGDKTNTINMYDGAEHLILEPVGAENETDRRASGRDRVLS